MKPFQLKEMEVTKQRPSLTSVIEHKKRMAALEAVSAQQRWSDGNETYTETEQKLMAETEGHMSLIGHLAELRKRILISVVAIIVSCIFAYYYSEDILGIMVVPAGKLYYLRPTEAFFTLMKISIVSGLIIASPVWIYELWAFVIPALTKGEQRITNLVIPIAIILFLLGVSFSYFFVLPAAIKFFIGFSTNELEPLFSVGQYIDFVIAFILPFGIIFELPLILVALGALGIITSDQLRKQRKMFILLAFIVGAAISPTPDMFSQTMIAGPMVILYELSLYVIRYILRK